MFESLLPRLAPPKSLIIPKLLSPIPSISITRKRPDKHIINTDPVRNPIRTCKYHIKHIGRRHRLERRRRNRPLPRRRPAHIIRRRHATLGSLVRVLDRNRASTGGGVELVVYFDGVVAAAAGVHGLRKGEGAGAVGGGAGGEGDGKGVGAAVVGAAGGDDGGGCGAGDAADGPGGWGIGAGFEVGVLEDGACGAGFWV